MRRLIYLFMLAVVIVPALAFLTIGCGDSSTTTSSDTESSDADVQQQLDELKSGLPKFAVPMREVGDRFANMYYAAEGGNWGLAAYMSSYMDKAMNPAKVTKPDEYPVWASFYSTEFEPVNQAIDAKDFAAFDQAYTQAISDCNACHASMGYTFIVVSKADKPADNNVDYALPSEPTDLPK